MKRNISLICFDYGDNKTPSTKLVFLFAFILFRLRYEKHFCEVNNLWELCFWNRAQTSYSYCLLNQTKVHIFRVEVKGKLPKKKIE